VVSQCLRIEPRTYKMSYTTKNQNYHSVILPYI